MLHGPAYRSGRDPDLESIRARRRFGRHMGNQAAKGERKGGLSSLILMALAAISLMVWVQNRTLPGIARDWKHMLADSGCATAHHLGRPSQGEKGFWGSGRFDDPECRD